MYITKYLNLTNIIPIRNDVKRKDKQFKQYKITYF